MPHCNSITNCNCIKNKWVTVLIDQEGSWDKNYGKALGAVEGKYFKVFQPTNGDDAEKLINLLFGIGKKQKLKAKIDALFIDSVSAVVPTELLEGEDSSGKGSSKGVHARFWNNLIKKLNKIALKDDVAIVLVNQLRDVINMDSIYQEKNIVNDNKLASGYSSDNSKTTTGGNGIRFYASLRILLQQTRRAKVKTKLHGKEIDTKNKINYIRMDVIKSKIGVPFTRANASILFGKGFDDRLPMFDYLTKEAKAITASTSGVYTLTLEGKELLSIKGAEKFKRELFTNHIDDLKKAYLHYRRKAHLELFDIEEDEVLNEDIDLDEITTVKKDKKKGKK